ncbi:MAG: hypothetical protein ACFFKA_09625, partial [Candidatus Thorarchaeota archaeon]
LLENYTSQTNFLIYLDILERKVELNGVQGLAYSSPKVKVQDPAEFIFVYKDIDTQEIIGDLTIASYTWQERFENGTIIPGRNGMGILTQNANKTYSLDFNTESRSVGFYFLYVTLQKENFEARSALINLEIILREFNVNLNTDNIQGNQLIVPHGSDLTLEIVINDSSRDNIPLENALVVLKLEGLQYTFNELSPGVYSYTIETSELDTFFSPRLMAGTLIVEKSNFTSQEIRVTINVQMEEIFPGMPKFYFILLISSVVGIVGSLATYRIIQQARIPKFVKKVRKVKSLIKSNKPVSDSLLTKTKEQMMVDLYSEDWKNLNLSLEPILGIEDTRLKEISKKLKKSTKEEE